MKEGFNKYMFYELSHFSILSAKELNPKGIDSSHCPQIRRAISIVNPKGPPATRGRLVQRKSLRKPLLGSGDQQSAAKLAEK